MFAQNGNISGRQLHRLFVLDLFAASSMILPRLLPRVCGRQGFYAIGAAALFTLLISAVYIKAAIGCGSDLYSSASHHGGRPLGFCIMLFFMTKFLLSAAFILKMFSEVISRTFLTEMPERLIAALMLLTALYGASKGMETRGRLGEILMWFVLVPVMLIVFLAAFQMRGSRIFPMEITNVREIFSGSFLCAAVFSVCEFLLFAAPYVRCESRPKAAAAGMKTSGQENLSPNVHFWELYKFAAKAIMAAFLCTAAIYVVCIGIFSADGAAAEQWPSVTLMQVIRLPGRFISRQDGLMLAVWMGSIFVLLGSYIFYTGKMARQLFQKKHFKGMMLLWLVLVYALFWVIDDYGRFEQFYWKIMAFLGLPVSVLIAVWLLVCGNKKEDTRG